MTAVAQHPVVGPHALLSYRAIRIALTASHGGELRGTQFSLTSLCHTKDSEATLIHPSIFVTKPSLAHALTQGGSLGCGWFCGPLP